MDPSPNIYALHSDTTETKSSNDPAFIIIIIILILVAIGLVIWLVVKHMQDTNKNDKTVDITNPKILADSTSITGSWSATGSLTDKITLYVSTDPINPSSDGTIPCNQTTVKCASNTGSNNSITISGLSLHTTYHCWLIATGDNTSHFKPFSKTVFTQTTVSIQASQKDNNLFEIRNLNSPSGSVSKEAQYTTEGTDTGLYRLGSAIPTASSVSDSFIINYSTKDIPTTADDIKGETNLILCRDSANNDVVFGEWCNHNDSNSTDAPNIDETPDIRVKGKCGSSSSELAVTDTISSTACQWNYSGPLPSGAEGTNRWCLTSSQQTNSTSNIKENMCMSKNGTSLGLVSLSSGDPWFNTLVAGTTT